MRRTTAIALTVTCVIMLTCGSLCYGFAGSGGDGGRASLISFARGGGGEEKGLIGVDFLRDAIRLPDQGRLSADFFDLQTRETGAKEAQYLGYTYLRADSSRPDGQGLGFTGERHGGRKIYVKTTGATPPKVPDRIYLPDNGTFVAYDISGRPPVYAYTLYGAYNTNETVAFGLADEGGGRLNLSNTAPYVIQQLAAGGNWVTVFTPVAAQVIVPMENGTFIEWQWDQRLDDGSLAPFGDYRALINGVYEARFRIASDTPAVERSAADFGLETADAAFTAPPETDAFARAFILTPYTRELQDEMTEVLLFKAWRKRLDAGTLRQALNRSAFGDTDTIAIPCLAVNARYEGSPVWILVLNAKKGGDRFDTRYYIVADGVLVRERPSPR